VAYVGDSLEGMQRYLDDGSVQLFMTSPPFALSRNKEYGNQPSEGYVEWFKDFAAVMWDKLRDDGSLVIDLGGAWNKGSPTRSLYQFKLLLHLCEGLGDRSFFLAQDFYWHNPAKMPLPAQWVNVERIRVKDSVNVIWWLSKSERPKADNRRVLRPYSAAMEQLLEKQSYNGGTRPGGARVNSESWKHRHSGAIPPSALEVPYDPAIANEEFQLLRDNFLRHGGSESASRYHRACNALRRRYHDPQLTEQVRKHPARFPLQIPSFFISMLTDEGDLVVDPFAGSNVTGQAAEDSLRRWAAFEMHRHYLEPSVARFNSYFSGNFDWLGTGQPLLSSIPASEFA
jgi:site-specific DNA-methyltransferase (cytosine-N4-specific)